MDQTSKTDQIDQRNQKGERSETSQSNLIRRYTGSAGLFLWGTRDRMLEQPSDLFLENRQIPFYHRPDFRQVNAEIVMHQHMAHFDDLWPGNLLNGSCETRN